VLVSGRNKIPWESGFSGDIGRIMDVRILVSVDGYETRAAILENCVLVEYLFERTEHRRATGNIYKGRVCSIIPGMQASFVDVGLGRNAFLFVSDVLAPSWGGYCDMMQEGNDEIDLEDEEGFDEDIEASELPLPSIQDLMKEGQELLVQMDKEPIGDKGARVTANISLPGRYVVLLPTSRHVGVSRKIESVEEKYRLREVGKGLVGEEYGLILRTAAAGATEAALKEDLDSLVKEWDRIQRASREAKAPAMLHHELGLAHRILRDAVNHDHSEFIIDDRELFEDLRQTAPSLRPDLSCCFTLYEGRAPLLRAHGVDGAIEKLLERKVWLDCGGHIVIDETEALTSIDVNTGRFIGDRDLEETVLHANIEAAKEIARQIRLRNIGGIIIIDFIDMKSQENWDIVVGEIEAQIQRDRAFTRVLGVTELGLVEMTRKRAHKSLGRALRQPCPYCKREGMVFSLQTMGIKTLRRLEILCNEQPASQICIYVHPTVAGYVNREMADSLEAIRARTGKEVEVVGQEQIHIEEIRIRPVTATSDPIPNMSC